MLYGYERPAPRARRISMEGASRGGGYSHAHIRKGTTPGDGAAGSQEQVCGAASPVRS